MPSTPFDAEPRPPADFAPVLATKDPVLLVGGQAINLWALYYQDRTADLAPFVSRDTDVLGDRETLVKLGKIAGSRPQFFPLRPPSNEVGVVIAKDAAGSPMLIEVLRYINGASNEELHDPAYTIALGEKQVLVRVPGPIALLKAKIANVVDLNQTGRQDRRHVNILARIIPAYLEDLRRAAAEGRLDERKLLQYLEQLLYVVTATSNLKVLVDLKISAGDFFTELKPDKLPKLTAFLEKRLKRALSATGLMNSPVQIQ